MRDACDRGWLTRRRLLQIGGLGLLGLPELLHAGETTGRRAAPAPSSSCTSSVGRATSTPST